MTEHLLPIIDLWISETRQRRFLEVSDLKESIAQLGQLQNIVVTRETGPNGELYKVLAGARRTTAMRELGELFIRAMFIDDLPETEQQIIELHENIKRSNLSWQEEAVAVARFLQLRPDSSINSVAEELSVHRSFVDSCVAVAPFICDGEQYDERIAKADTLTAAANVIRKRQQMQRVTASSKLISAITPKAELLSDGEAVPIPAHPTEDFTPVICADAIHFMQHYTGPKVDFFHLDLPYGIGYAGTNTARVKGSHQQLYDDRPDNFLALLDAFCEHYSNMTAAQSHLIFWFDMRYYSLILDRFGRTEFELVSPAPIIWGKSDFKGISSDPQRRLMHIYETALLFSLGDRKLRGTSGDCLWYPTLRSDREHRNEKPEPMLRKLFPAFIDPETVVFDPTCGSASALGVADELGAAHVFGTEIIPEMVEAANARLKSRRALRMLSGK